MTEQRVILKKFVNGTTWQELADAAGVNRTKILNWTCGSTPLTAKEMRKISDFLQSYIKNLFDAADEFEKLTQEREGL